MSAQIPWVLEGVLVGSLAFWAGVLGVNVWDWWKKTHPRVTKSRRLACASASKDLMPIITRLGTKPLWGRKVAPIPLCGSKLLVFSGDGSYMLTGNGTRWREKIVEWATQGLDVKYILLQADDAVKAKFRRLVADVDAADSGAAGGIEVVVLCPEGRKALGDEVVSKLETVHPTLVIGGNGRNAAWIEGHHEPGSEFAYDISYLSPDELDNNKSARDRFERYRSIVNRVLDHCQPMPASNAA